MALASAVRLLFQNGTRFSTKSSPFSLFSAYGCSTTLPLSASVGGPPAARSCSARAAPGRDPPAAPTPACKNGVPGNNPQFEPLPDPRIKGPAVPQAALVGNPLATPASPHSSCICAQGDDPSPAVATGNDPSAAPRVPPSGDFPYAPEVGPDNPKPKPGRSSSKVPLPDPRAAPTTPAPRYANCMRSQGGDPLADSCDGENAGSHRSATFSLPRAMALAGTCSSHTADAPGAPGGDTPANAATTRPAAPGSDSPAAPTKGPPAAPGLGLERRNPPHRPQDP